MGKVPGESGKRVGGSSQAVTQEGTVSPCGGGSTGAHQSWWVTDTGLWVCFTLKPVLSAGAAQGKCRTGEISPSPA